VSNVDVVVNIVYTIEPESFEINGNASEEGIDEILSTFIEQRICAGVDKTPTNKYNTYNISIGVNVGTGDFYCKHDCKNKGLRDGIIMRVLLLREKNAQEKDQI